MSQALPMGGTAASPARLVWAVCAAHFVSHYYIIVLAPLMPFVREAYGVSYTELALALSVFNGVTAALQTPAGFLVDRFGARRLLVAGLATGGIAFVMVGLIDSYWVLVAMFALAGLGNTVYHPADYTLLTQNVSAKRLGQAYSIHTFGGMLGFAAAPVSLLFMQSLWGWRGAFIGAGLLGLAVAAVIALMRDPPPVAQAARGTEAEAAAGWRLLLSPPILVNMLFFLLIALNSIGVFNYSVVALGALYGTPVTTASAALTSFLLVSAVGVLAGGVIVGRAGSHNLVATGSLIGMAVAAALLAAFDFGTIALMAVMGLFGFCFGFLAPSRDMIVREATPAGSFGKVFGFVSTGFNIGGIIAPLIFGALMDHGSPRLVFVGIACASLAAILTVAAIPKRPAAA